MLIKLCLLIALIGIGAYNRRRSVPRLESIAKGGEAPGRAGVLLRRALRAEVALIAVVLGVTGALASYAPPVSAQSGPFSSSTTLGPTELEMTVDPARVGGNQIICICSTPRAGPSSPMSRSSTSARRCPTSASARWPWIRTSQARGITRSERPVERLRRLADRVTLRVSAFDQYAKKIEVPIR